MPRDRANLRIDIWGDRDWRSLSLGAQWLYEYLLTSPKLLYVGVADWRPSRIARLVSGVTGEDIERFGEELATARFVVIDEESDEIQLRSFLRHDGILQNPNMWKSIGLDFTAVASPKLMASIAHEVRRLRDENPDGFRTAKSAKGQLVNPWETDHLRTLLDTPSDTPSTPAEQTPSDTPSHTPSDRGSDRGSPTSTATATTTEASLPTASEGKKRETRLPQDWAPTAAHLTFAREKGLDVLAAAEAFRLHAETHDRHAVQWNSAFTTWLKREKPRQQATGARQVLTPDEMRRRREEAMGRG